MFNVGQEVLYFPTNWVTGALRRESHYYGQPARIVEIKGRLVWLMFEDKTVSYAKISEIKKRVISDGGKEDVYKKDNGC